MRGINKKKRGRGWKKVRGRGKREREGRKRTSENNDKIGLN